jgi:phosphoribosylglycinamide formyltransferase-1
MRILTAGFVAGWPDRLINIHPSLLPAFPGLDTHRRALEAGARFGGCTVHFVRPGLDDGPIIIQAAVPIRDHDTAETLAARVLEWEHQCYPRAVRWIAEGRTRIEGARVMVDDGTAPSTALINPH